MLAFQLLQLVHELVEVGVGDLRIVEHVIAVLVVADFVAEGFDLLFDVLGRGNHDEEDYIRDGRSPCKGRGGWKRAGPTPRPAPMVSFRPNLPSSAACSRPSMRCGTLSPRTARHSSAPAP